MKIYYSKSYLFVLSLFIGSGAFLGCNNDDNGGDPTPTANYSSTLTALSNNVIVNTYSDLANQASNLSSKVTALKDNPTAANLEAAQNAWVATRQPWEQSEGFLFGPVDTEGIDPALDSWPVNQVDLENVLASSNALSKTYVVSLDGTLKGFHTIEFLLWGADGTKNIADFSQREYEYLLASTEVLADDANTLADAWEAAGGNFVDNLINAGNSGSIYISQKSALEELTAGIVGIADEVGNGKINDPLAQEDFSLEESQFSDNSKTDFTNNIRSIQNIYIGISGNGLTDVVSEVDAALDTRVKSEIEAAIQAIQAIPGTFTDAIPASSPSRPAAEAAQAAVRKLQATLEGDLTNLVSNL